MTLLVRVIVGIIVVVSIGIVIDEMAETGMFAALGQWLMRGWQIFLRWFQPYVERFMLRRAMRPFWSGLTLVFGFLVSLFIGGKNQKAVKTGLARVWNKRPDWPRWVYTLFALAVISGAIVLYFLIWERFGAWWGFWYSVAASLIIEKLPLIGFDYLLDHVSEKWRPFKRWYRLTLRKGPWKYLAYAWGRPILRKIALDLHRKRRMWRTNHGDQSAIEIWRARQRARGEEEPLHTSWIAGAISISITIILMDVATGTHLLHNGITQFVDMVLVTAYAWTH